MGWGESAPGDCLLDSATLPRGQHVPRNDIANDPGDEGVASLLGDEPSVPLQLVQRFVQLVCFESGGQ